MKKINFIKSARRTILLEASGLQNLAKILNKDFSSICEILSTTKGKIICLGVGKSGHIANKTSATLSSTGSSSIFINAAEALHGDIGGIEKKDTVLLFSHSGETEEIVSLLPTLKNIGCNFFSITGNNNSRIAVGSMMNIATGVTDEACPLNLAPTTSTTAALAIGDAIAVALLEAKEFSSEDFAKSHPGGKLGKRLILKVVDIMHKGKELPLIQPSAILSDVLFEMSSKGLGAALVTDKEKNLKGIFTDGDLRRTLNQEIDFHKTKISQIMSRNVKTIDESLLATDAIEIMQRNEIYMLVVTKKNKKISGLIRMHDLLKAGLI